MAIVDLIVLLTRGMIFYALMCAAVGVGISLVGFRQDEGRPWDKWLSWGTILFLFLNILVTAVSGFGSLGEKMDGPRAVAAVLAFLVVMAVLCAVFLLLPAVLFHFHGFFRPAAGLFLAFVSIHFAIVLIGSLAAANRSALASATDRLTELGETISAAREREQARAPAVPDANANRRVPKTDPIIPLPPRVEATPRLPDPGAFGPPEPPIMPGRSTPPVTDGGWFPPTETGESTPPGIPGAPGDAGDPRQRYGRNRVVQLHLLGVTGRDVERRLTDRLASMVDPGEVATVSVSVTGLIGSATVAPVSDLAAFRSQIDFGEVVAAHEDQRVLVVRVGPTRSRAAPVRSRNRTRRHLTAATSLRRPRPLAPGRTRFRRRRHQTATHAAAGNPAASGLLAALTGPWLADRPRQDSGSSGLSDLSTIGPRPMSTSRSSTRPNRSGRRRLGDCRRRSRRAIPQAASSPEAACP